MAGGRAGFSSRASGSGEKTPRPRHMNASSYYASFPAQYSSGLCASSPNETSWWTGAVMAKHESEWTRGDAAVCPDGEACWLATHSTRRAETNTSDQLVTMFLTSAARPDDANGVAARRLLQVIATTRRALSLARAPVTVGTH